MKKVTYFDYEGVVQNSKFSFVTGILASNKEIELIENYIDKILVSKVESGQRYYIQNTNIDDFQINHNYISNIVNNKIKEGVILQKKLKQKDANLIVLHPINENISKDFINIVRYKTENNLTIDDLNSYFLMIEITENNYEDIKKIFEYLFTLTNILEEFTEGQSDYYIRDFLENNIFNTFIANHNDGTLYIKLPNKESYKDFKNINYKSIKVVKAIDMEKHLKNITSYSHFIKVEEFLNLIEECLEENKKIIYFTDFINEIKSLKEKMTFSEFNYIIELFENQDNSQLAFELFYSYNHRKEYDTNLKCKYIFAEYKSTIQRYLSQLNPQIRKIYTCKNFLEEHEIQRLTPTNEYNFIKVLEIHPEEPLLEKKEGISEFSLKNLILKEVDPEFYKYLASRYVYYFYNHLNKEALMKLHKKDNLLDLDIDICVTLNPKVYLYLRNEFKKKYPNKSQEEIEDILNQYLV